MGKKTEASSDSLGEGKLIKVGKQLLSPRKSKDDLIKALQVCSFPPAISKFRLHPVAFSLTVVRLQPCRKH
jgi:hypothetical protein